MVVRRRGSGGSLPHCGYGSRGKSLHGICIYFVSVAVDTATGPNAGRGVAFGPCICETMRRAMNVTISSSSSRPAGKGCATVFLGLFAVIGLVFLCFMGRAGWDSVRPYFWKKTDCVIESSHIDGHGGDAGFKVRYSYEFDGRKYTGTRHTMGMTSSMNEVLAQRLVQRYAPGRPAYCHVNPSAPVESVLERAPLWPLLFAVVPLIFFAVGVLGIIAVWRAKPVESGAVSDRHRGGGNAVLGLRVFASMFILVGGGVGYGLFVRPLMKAWTASAWPAVPCEILTSRMSHHTDSDGGSTFSIDVRYRYMVGGTEFTGTAYNFDTGSSSGREWRANVVASLPKGRRTVCYVNPEDPLDAVLSREVSSDMWFGLIPGVFLVVGLVLFWKAPALGRKHSPVPGGDGLPLLPRTGSAAPIAGGGTSGEVELKASQTPGCAFSIILLIALFWNGVTWGIMLATGPRDWGTRIFLGIFVIIGLLLAVGAFVQFLALFNPRPVLTAGAPAVPLGGSVAVRWRFTGNVRRITRLRLSLMAREEATYRRGTTTATDKSVFLNTVLLETADRAQMPGGSVQVEIPRGLIHTFTAQNNKIVWLLHLHGDIPRWPDVDAEFQITVLPRDVATLFPTTPSDT